MQDRIISLHKKAYDEITAYKDFLNKQNVNSVNDIHSVNDIPITNKKSYLQAYKQKDLMWKEDQEGLILYCSTSGSTGKPYYFPRNETLSEQYASYLEEYILQSSHGMGRTLVIVGFGMGVWIGGIITQSAFEIAAKSMKHPISILPTGYNKSEIFKGLTSLAPNYDQTILVGYPPFVKDLVDEAEEKGINLKNLNIRLLFAAETFTETFRNYVSKKAGVKNQLLDTANIYGSADVGAMARETPLSILIRRIALEDPSLFNDLFGQIEKIPTLAQYNPDHIIFEEVDGELILTADSSLPLIRYAIGDHGGVLSFDKIAKVLEGYDIDITKLIEDSGLKGNYKTEPFVYVYERTDLSITLHGINIYPEFIKEALLDDSLSPYFTERFTMSTKHDIRHNQFLLINLELRNNIETTIQLITKATETIRKKLMQKSSEFTEISKSVDSKNLIKVALWPKNHPRYFTPGTKQKWVEKH